MSLPVYVLVLLAFRRPESAEAALKYLVLGGTATATLLMGASLLYGGSGSLALAAFARRAGLDRHRWRASRVVLVIVAFFLKAAIAPFHAWAPDAYEAATVPVTAYMAAIVKAGVLLAAVRLFGTANAADADGGPARAAAAGFHRLGQPRRDAPAELSPHDRVFLDRARRATFSTRSLATPPAGSRRSRSTCIAYGSMNLLAFASLPPRRRRRGAGSPRQPEGPVPSRSPSPR